MGGILYGQPDKTNTKSKQALQSQTIINLNDKVGGPSSNLDGSSGNPNNSSQPNEKCKSKKALQSSNHINYRMPTRGLSNQAQD